MIQIRNFKSKSYLLLLTTLQTPTTTTTPWSHPQQCQHISVISGNLVDIQRIAPAEYQLSGVAVKVGVVVEETVRSRFFVISRYYPGSIDGEVGAGDVSLRVRGWCQ